MAKITSNEYVKIAWILDANMTQAQAAAPTTAILNAGLDLSPAIAWQDFALGATDSDDVEDRGITDPGNAVTRGFANFEATLSFFRDANADDSTSAYVQAFETFRVPRTYGWLVLRVAEKKWSDPWAAGDRVSVFRFIADTVTDDATGDDSVKFTVNFLQQGVLYPYTAVAGGTGTATPTTLSLVVGDAKPVVVNTAGKDITSQIVWTSSDTTKASVTTNGIVKGIAAGTATITGNHAALSAPISVTTTVTAS